ncbi:sugar-binding transcriptional regulator [Neobacillus sp. MM2021_6]|uniref:sugar-binding transcriptional regulator n=1 Tax=Bacillaceae TaxID=186817 RepID=UPI0014074709|nr:MULTISPECIES: sugar-binding transcriptional regulator [Bacillaceae]MBO0958666.1 sugar-binding transcriptional regulator [Neobacillus sp. MM2021_6]NHC20194.1 sugar-binding transcriptional regulator [Bacillus sp. MM2020_4]
MANSDNNRMLTKVARMYYDEGATQAEIAKILGVSRSLISKYLIMARESGIVKIIINEDFQNAEASQLEKELEQRFGLREAIVVTESRDLGLSASNYLLRIVRNNQIIGVSSGIQVAEVASALKKQQTSMLTIIPLVGGIGHLHFELHANQITSVIADKLGAEHKFLHAPVVVDSAEAKEVFLKQSLLSEVFILAERCDIAIVGIGGEPESSTIVEAFINEDDRRESKEKGAVGVVCNNFIDSNGQEIDGSWNSRVISISIDSLKKIPTVIGIVHGDRKVPAIRAALNGKMINVLITDQLTAEKLLM